MKLVGAGATGALTARMGLKQAVVATAGMTAATSIATGGNIKQDVSLAVIGTVVGHKLKTPFVKAYTSEMIQKAPVLIEKIINDTIEEKK